MPFYLPRSTAAWGSDAFNQTLQQEVVQLGLEFLPLQQQLTRSAYALEEGISAMLLSSEQRQQMLSLRIGVFFKGAIPGCACADDPTPEETYNEYCELDIQLDLDTSAATLKVQDWGGVA